MQLTLPEALQRHHDSEGDSDLEWMLIILKKGHGTAQCGRLAGSENIRMLHQFLARIGRRRALMLA